MMTQHRHSPYCDGPGRCVYTWDEDEHLRAKHHNTSAERARNHADNANDTAGEPGTNYAIKAIAYALTSIAESLETLTNKDGEPADLGGLSGLAWKRAADEL